jgi:NAD(P)-dependent dehydrogenase (short-subunit alcohol dehydrogenase family)
LEAITEEHFDKTFGINVEGLLFTVQRALPLFHNGGSIILNASINSSKGYEGMSVYSATKAAIRSFARSWTVDLKQRKIRVNAVSPGSRDHIKKSSKVFELNKPLSELGQGGYFVEIL